MAGSRHSKDDNRRIRAAREHARNVDRLMSELGDDDFRDDDEQPAEEAKLITLPGSAAKALGNGRIGGYLVTFGSPDTPDLEGDHFTRDTDFGPMKTSIVLYQHGMDKRLGHRVFDAEAKLEEDDIGVWIEAQLELRDAYERFIYDQVQAKRMGWSSGTAGHLVEAVPSGNGRWFKRWYLGLDASLTPTPAEYRNIAQALKSLPEAEPEAVGEIAAPAVQRKTYIIFMQEAAHG